MSKMVPSNSGKGIHSLPLLRLGKVERQTEPIRNIPYSEVSKGGRGSSLYISIVEREARPECDGGQELS